MILKQVIKWKKAFLCYCLKKSHLVVLIVVVGDVVDASIVVAVVVAAVVVVVAVISLSQKVVLVLNCDDSIYFLFAIN